MEIIELRHDNARKSGRSVTVRQKLICRVRERRDAARRVASRRIASRHFLISSFASAIIPSIADRNDFGWVRVEGSDRSNQETGMVHEGT